MRENIIQNGQIAENGRRYFEDDWFARGIPANVQVADSVYLKGSYGFGEFFSQQTPGFFIGMGSGIYDNCMFITGPQACIDIGSYTVINGTVMICNESLVIGSHCMTSWQTVITDTWPDVRLLGPEQRRMCMELTARDPNRRWVAGADPKPVVLEDNCWIGFGCVIMPGVRIGYGSIVASKTVVTGEVPPYTIVAGNPARIVRYLEPDNIEESRRLAFQGLIF